MIRNAIPVVLLLTGGALAPAQQAPAEVVNLEWKSKVYAVGSPVPVELWTRQEPYSKQLHASRIIVKCPDGKERRLRSSAKESKLRIDGGKYTVDIDASELATTSPAGKFELSFEYADGHRSQPLYGLWVKPLTDPAAQLKRDPSKVAALMETDEGNMLIELRADLAPKTVANFVKLASSGFYDGRIFHRVMRGFMIQGGGVKPDGTESGSDKIPFEASTLPHDRGVISMARVDGELDSASCQFFICHAASRNGLDGKYASFGKLAEGFGYDVLDRLASTPVGVGADGKEKSKPVKPSVIRRVAVVEKP
jgi:peptidyl-prolyl cis-trans isomerase B (cyclophilin B)